MLELIFKQYGIRIYNEESDPRSFAKVFQDMFLLLNADQVIEIFKKIEALENQNIDIF